MEEDEELAEQEESSRLDEVEEMVRDMVLVFFCTLWTLRTTHQNRDMLSHLSRRLFKASSACVCQTYCAMFQALQKAATEGGSLSMNKGQD